MGSNAEAVIHGGTLRPLMFVGFPAGYNISFFFRFPKELQYTMFRNRYRICLIIFGLLWIAASGPAIGRADTLEIGSPAPDFRLPGVDGKTCSLESFRDAEVLVMVFTCNHCPTAQAYEGRIEQIAADYKDKKVAVVAISPNDPRAVRLDELSYTDLGDGFEDMKLRAKDHGFHFPKDKALDVLNKKQVSAGNYLFEGDDSINSWTL